MTSSSLEDIKGKSLAVCILKKIPAVIGCLLFLCSMLFPFYHSIFYTTMIARPPMIEQSFSVYYWSYKSTVQTYRLRPPSGTPQRILEHWLCYYWFRGYFIRELRLSWMLVLMLITQIAALATSVASILINRRILALIPAITCPMVSVLMICASASLFKSNLAMDFYQLGYWLTYPSTALFIISFIIRVKLD
jgi:hypothetical protein